MNNIKDVIIKPLETSKYLKHFTMHFTQNGQKRSCDLLKIHDSVAILIYNIQNKTLVFVKQFRPVVYYGSIPDQDRKDIIDLEKYPPTTGITIELCAGLVDKPLSLLQIAKEEVLEECGYDVPQSNLVKIGSYRLSVDTFGGLQTAYYCEVSNEMKISEGGGVNGETIEVTEMLIPEVIQYVQEAKLRSPSSFLFAVYWFLFNKVK